MTFEELVTLEKKFGAIVMAAMRMDDGKEKDEITEELSNISDILDHIVANVK
jgi:hypothetical protein